MEKLPCEVKFKRRRLKNLLRIIRDQVEFYFSDGNLHRDHFLMEKTGSDGLQYVPIALLTTFNALKEIGANCTIIVKAIKSSNVLELDEENLLIKRKFALKPQRSNSDQCTIYVECLPPDVTIEWIKEVTQKLGKTRCISLPRYKKSGLIKGFAFIEFDREEDAQRACSVLNSPPQNFFPNRTGKYLANLHQRHRSTEGKLSCHDNKVSVKNHPHCATHKNTQKHHVTNEPDRKHHVTNEPDRRASSTREKKLSSKVVVKKPSREHETTNGERSLTEYSVKNAKVNSHLSNNNHSSLGADHDPHHARYDATMRSDLLQRRVSAAKMRKRLRSKSEPNDLDLGVPRKVPKTELTKMASKESVIHRDGLLSASLNSGLSTSASAPGKICAMPTLPDRKSENTATSDHQVAFNSSELDLLIVHEKRKSTLKPVSTPHERKLKSNSASKPKVASAVYVIPSAPPTKAKRRKRACTRKLSWRKWRTRQTPPILKAMPKVVWVDLKQNYLRQQREEMGKLKSIMKKISLPDSSAFIKKHLALDEFASKEEDSSTEVNNLLIRSNSEACARQEKRDEPTFTPGVIVHISRAKVADETKSLPSFKTIKHNLSRHGQISYVDVKPGSEEGHVRFTDSQSAQRAILDDREFSLRLLTGTAEESYWYSLLASRQMKRSRERPKHRGTEKLANRAVNVTCRSSKQHIKFSGDF